MHLSNQLWLGWDCQFSGDQGWADASTGVDRNITTFTGLSVCFSNQLIDILELLFLFLVSISHTIGNSIILNHFFKTQGLMLIRE